MLEENMMVGAGGGAVTAPPGTAIEGQYRAGERGELWGVNLREGGRGVQRRMMLTVWGQNGINDAGQCAETSVSVSTGPGFGTGHVLSQI